MNKTLLPKLRFPEFQDEWEGYFGNQLFDPISNKEHNSSLPVLAITQEHGAIPRDLIDYQVFVTDKSIASYKVVEVGDFIISLRSFQGGIEYSEYKGLCSPAYIILRKKNELSEAYFKYFFKTERFIQQLQKNLEGLRDGKMVSYEQFSELLLPTPTTAEQQKIADCLTSLDDLIAAQSQKVAALQAYKKGLMQNLFPAEGESVPRLRFPEFASAGEWEEKLLSEYFPHIRNGFVGIATPHYVSNGIPYLQGKNIKQGQIDPSELITISNDFHKKQQKSHLRINDILMVQSGHVGECAVVNQKFAGSNCHALIILSPVRNVDSSFFVYYFYSPQGKSEISKIKTGNTIEHILASAVKSIKVFVPSFAEQQRIAEFFNSIDEETSAQGESLAALKIHKRGVMQGLFPSGGGAEGEGGAG